MNKRLLMIIFLVVMLPGSLMAEERLRLATTTSTENSGLLAILHPPFENKYNVKVDVIAVGTGKALRLGQNGNVDLVMAHAPDAEKKFVSEGYGIKRFPVMHNDFVILGPANDPAGVKQSKSIGDALKGIAEREQTFVSRGDDSGTHKKELSLWQIADLEPQGKWYLAAGQGMGAVLRIANDKLAYTLADRGTYLAFKNKIDIELVFEGAKELFNPYHVILLNPEEHTHIKSGLARKYVDFIRSKERQHIIADFQIAGERLFEPNVIK